MRGWVWGRWVAAGGMELGGRGYFFSVEHVVNVCRCLFRFRGGGVKRKCGIATGGFVGMTDDAHILLGIRVFLRKQHKRVNQQRPPYRGQLLGQAIPRDFPPSSRPYLPMRDRGFSVQRPMRLGLRPSSG